MMLVHEFGHVLGAMATGGQVRRFVWHPLAFSRTDVMPNPMPMVVVWSGPMVGVLLPLMLAGLSTYFKLQWTYLMQFFAGFCSIANGAYISLGKINHVGDAGDMLRLGVPVWYMIIFGCVCIPVGLWLWHRASPRLGFGRSPHTIHPVHAYGVFIAGIVIVILALIAGDR